MALWDPFKEKFESMLLANGCDIGRLKHEFRIIFNHVLRFIPKISPTKAWPQLFQMRDSLGLHNILHIAELCIAVPISNAECERVFSFLWKIMTKHRMSLSNETLERLLQLRGASNFNPSNYEHAIELFLTEYPDGTTRKRPSHLDGHNFSTEEKIVIYKKENNFT